MSGICFKQTFLCAEELDHISLTLWLLYAYIYICYFQNLPFSELGVGLEGKLPWNEWAFYKNMKYTVLK